MSVVTRTIKKELKEMEEKKQAPSQMQQAVKSIVEQTLFEIRESLVRKGIEYSRNMDPFHNFKKGAIMGQKNPFEVLDSYALKHAVSIQDLVEDHLSGETLNMSVINEKFDDYISYMVLKKAMLLYNNQQVIDESL